MRFFPSPLVYPVLLLWLLAGCNGFVVFSNGRLLAVITVNPNTADPLNFPNNQVQFTAIGTFNVPPSPVNPLPNVVWTLDRPAFSGLPPSGHASIDGNGNAQCAPGFVGTIQVFATAPLDPNQPLSITNQKVGTAQLICP